MQVHCNDVQQWSKLYAGDHTWSQQVVRKDDLQKRKVHDGLVLKVTRHTFF